MQLRLACNHIRIKSEISKYEMEQLLHLWIEWIDTGNNGLSGFVKECY